MSDPRGQRQAGTAIALAVAMVLLSGTAQAQSIPAGRLLASNCFQCHGTNGKGPGFDTLAGKSSSEIYSDLLKFLSGAEGQGMMTKHAFGYTDAQLRAIAAYFATQR